MAAMLRILSCCIALLSLTACDFLRESDTDSGVSSEGVTARKAQTEIGSGSPVDWDIKNCAVVENRSEWRWNPPRPNDPEGDEGDADPYIFHIDQPGDWQSKGKVGDVLISLLPLSSCKINDSTKIAYTTKNWLCVDDYVKVNGVNCLIKAIEEL